MSDLNDKTKDELAEIASAMDIEGRSSMSKDELVKAIEKAGKKPADGKVTPIIPDPPDEERPHETFGNPVALAELGERETADQSSGGGTGGGGFNPTGGVNPVPSGTSDTASTTGDTL